jgi:hypothetical protein
MEQNKLITNMIDKYFNKPVTKTGHETLAHYDNDIMIAGGSDGKFYTHINYHTIHNALLELIKLNKEHYVFVETGCSAHGTKSTLIWDNFVNIFDGIVRSVDLTQKAVTEANKVTTNKTLVTCSDSLKYLPTLNEDIDFLYLDSYDVNFLKPLPSAEHHLKEFMCVKHLLHPGSIVLIDDTPCSPEWLDNGTHCPIYNQFKAQFDQNMCGKGSLVNIELEKMGATKIMHQYQTLWKI